MVPGKHYITKEQLLKRKLPNNCFNSTHLLSRKLRSLRSAIFAPMTVRELSKCWADAASAAREDIDLLRKWAEM